MIILKSAHEIECIRRASYSRHVVLVSRNKPVSRRLIDDNCWRIYRPRWYTAVKGNMGSLPICAYQWRSTTGLSAAASLKTVMSRTDLVALSMDIWRHPNGHVKPDVMKLLGNRGKSVRNRTSESKPYRCYRSCQSNVLWETWLRCDFAGRYLGREMHEDPQPKPW